MAETSNSVKSPPPSNEPPFRLLKSEITPPSPNRPDPETGSITTIDWIPDFAGYAWVAYGASSLLVISHFPNPLSETEPKIGPFFRQVLELSADGSGIVSAVAWSTDMPSSGDVAACLDNCIGLFSFDHSSFVWSQTATLLQTTNVESIKWTSSGDGIIAGGLEVVLWRKKEMTWEIAWKVKPELPHSLVSASWSIEGPSATAPSGNLLVEDPSSSICEARKCVLVCYGVGDSIYQQANLRHPMPVSMIQWRPSIAKRRKRNDGPLSKSVLLTCCLDGSVRLWCEVDDVRIRKSSKDVGDHKATRSSFRVVACIDVNEALRGVLGSNMFIRWASEIDAIITLAKKANHYTCSDDHLHVEAGRCDWLIGFGRDNRMALWAIHCLDDHAPLRYPRVTLWKTHELVCPEGSRSMFLLDKVFIMRTRSSAPPEICSFIKLSGNTLSWELYSPTLSNLPDETDNLLSNSTKEILNIDSHTGKILQVALHPHMCEIELAASLDSDGVLLLWSLSTSAHSIMGMPTLNPFCKCSGKYILSSSKLKYTSLTWTPVVLDENAILAAGHGEGIDLLMTKTPKMESESFVINKLCSIPLVSHLHGQAPTGVWTIPCPSTSDETFLSIFLLVAMWKNDFHAVSWKISVHHCVSLENRCACGFETPNFDEKNWYTFKGSLFGKHIYVSVQLCSSVFPDLYKFEMVSSSAVLSPRSAMTSKVGNFSSANLLNKNYPAYHMVTGCSDGSLKLWRSIQDESSSLNSQWDLVGMHSAHEGSVSKVCPSCCGQKIATVSSTDVSNTSSVVMIWEIVNLGVAGGFMLEDTLYVDGEVIALNWLMMGNGVAVLGVCLKNKLQVYAPKQSGVLGNLTSDMSLIGRTWVCIAVSPTCSTINDFFWGTKAMPIVVHDKYFCFFSHLLFRANDDDQLSFKDGPYSYQDGSNKDKSLVFCHPCISNDENSFMDDLGRKNVFSSSTKLLTGDDFPSIIKVVTSNKKYSSGSSKCLCSLVEVVEQLSGRLSIFHPKALLINICSGNWRRAYVVMQHLSKHPTSQDVLEGGHCSRRSSFFTPPVPLSTYLDGTPSSYASKNTFNWSADIDMIATSSQLENGSYQHFSMLGNSSLESPYLAPQKSESSDFIDTVNKLFDAAVVTHTEKLQLCAIVDLLQEIRNQQVSSPYESLDEPGRRFWASVRFQRLYFSQKCGRPPTAGELVVDSRLIGWAYHSDCQDNLFDSLLPSESSWEEMCDIRIGYWYTNAAQLRMKMEKLARRQYLKSKDPKACALLYIALNRIQVLAGLFKISKDEKDKPWVGFLSRNFQDEKNKAAAVKNAYVLMGKHQLELAVAFFLLGGDSTSAITVCAKNLGDVQLALVLCRLIDGYRGPLEHHLVSKFLIPSALDNGDFWLASILELMIGNHSQAILTLLGLQGKSTCNKSVISFNQASFLDPSVGQYCLMLTTKTAMKNAIGDRSAGILGRWSVLMTTSAFSRCGLPLEALECLSSLHNMFSGLTQSSIPEVSDPVDDILKLLPCTSPSNWISSDVACNIELQTKSDMAAQYMAILLREHPSWQDTNFVACTSAELSNKEFHISLEKFQDKFRSSLLYFQQKLSLVPLYIVNKIVIYLFNSDLHSIGCFIHCSYISEKFPSETSDVLSCFPLCPVPCKLLLKTTREVSCMILRYILVCSLSSTKLRSGAFDDLVVEEGNVWGLYRWSLIWLLQSLRATLNMFSSSHPSDFSDFPFYILDIFEYCVYFATAWSERNFKVLILILKPLLRCIEEYDPVGTDVRDLNGTLLEAAKMLAYDPSIEAGIPIPINEQIEHEGGANISSLVPEDERWQLISASLWACLSYFLKDQMGRMHGNLEGGPSLELAGEISSMTMSDTSQVNAEKSHIRLMSDLLDKLLYLNHSHGSLYSAKQFVSYLISKDDVSNATILLCSKNSQTLSKTEEEKNLYQGEEDMMHYPKKTLWNICSNPKFISGGLLQENYECFRFIKKKSIRDWSFTYANITEKCKADEMLDKEDTHGSPSKADRSPRACHAPNDHPFLSLSKDPNGTKRSAAPFHNPIEIYKRSGELFEAVCINSIDQQEAALASNRKGLLFFKFEDGMPFGREPEYVWSKADWPLDGWAGSDFTPVPTCVSPGVGLGSNKGKHFGLGGATVGTQVRLGRDIMGGVASGAPGYAGMSSTKLGWGTEEEFDEFMDPPASADNVRTRSLAAHPSRPLLLVGSSNTHIYLWEFGKDRATATYGVLPAANVPPPYALASISSVCFGHCGHRFVTGALDGTVCTWQLEVGGRSNIRPTESSSCFDNHTSDVSYVTASGSIVAAAGHSSNGINVVVWDTLAPPATSRASIMCHEGGARSLAVFDNNIGSGSISPLIVTGGRDGDVGVHDFRYIATGRAKRQKHPDSTEQNNQSSTVNMRNKTGDQNRNGMLWYIPKAHSGTVTKISTIPHTSLFLTGSKDGDVKLWDAKQSRLVYHWPRLHERHTFLQPNSRGFGGVVRAAVTDIQVIPSGFLSCGGDGSVKMVELEDLSCGGTF